jgi:predicted deacylase
MAKKPGKYIESFIIPPSKTHNTLPPFNSGIITGPECKLEAVRIVGNSSSPCIYIGGGTHGDEINGIAAVLRLINEIKPQSLNGSLVLVPVQNPLGFKYRQRLNPYDPIDPDWVHTGKPSGAYTKNLKKALYNLVQKADCVIDLHTAGRGGFNNTMIYVPPETGDGTGEESLRLSVAFGGDQIIQGEGLDYYGWPVHYALPFVFAREGKAGIYAESGEGGCSLPDISSIDYFVTGVCNVMKSLGMIEGDVVEQGMRNLIDPLKDDSVSVKSPVEGIFLPESTAGEKVEKGKLLGKVYGIPSGVYNIESPRSGYIMWRSSFGSIGDNERLFSISI